MGWLQDHYKKIVDEAVYFFRDTGSVKVILYSVGAFLLVSLIVFMFSMQYTGTNLPGDLFDSENFSFSYAGNPTYAYVVSDWDDIGINGINGTTASVTVYGASDIEIYPSDNAAPAPRTRPLKRENGHYILHTLPADATTISINVKQEDKFDYNMHLAYNKAPGRDAAAVEKPGNDTLFKVYRKGSDQYVLASYFNNTAPKAFGVKNAAKYVFPVTICITDRTTENIDCAIDSVERLNYSGSVRIKTHDKMALQIPVSEISPIGKRSLKNVNMINSEGHLDVRHAQYDSSHADDINITSVPDSTTFKLMNGMVIVSGRASSLSFRERQFHVPMSVILKEGNFAIIIGLLSSFTTLFMQRLFGEFKK